MASSKFRFSNKAESLKLQSLLWGMSAVVLIQSKLDCLGTDNKSFVNVPILSEGLAKAFSSSVFDPIELIKLGEPLVIQS